MRYRKYQELAFDSFPDAKQEIVAIKVNKMLQEVYLVGILIYLKPTPEVRDASSTRSNIHICTHVRVIRFLTEIKRFLNFLSNNVFSRRPQALKNQ